jgi:hypothetical protein
LRIDVGFSQASSTSAPRATDGSLGVFKREQNMVWFWTRDDEELQLETRYDNETAEFVVTVMPPEGTSVPERFKDIEAFRARLVLLEDQLEAKNWRNTGRPLLSPEGFPRQRLT